MGAPQASRHPLGGDSRLAGRGMREGSPRGVSAQGLRLVPGEGRFQASCQRREAFGEGWREGPHPTPTPSLTDALPDVLGPLPPDAVDPDQEGVPRLQEVEQGGLQCAVPRATDGQREGVPGLEHVLDALLDLVHDLGAVDMQVTASPTPTPGRRPLRALTAVSQWPTWNISLCMCPIVCLPPAAMTRGVRLEGPGPSRSRLGRDRGLLRASGGATSSGWEAMVLTQPAALCPRAALAAVSARSISQQALHWTMGTGGHGGVQEARLVDGFLLHLLSFAVCRCYQAVINACPAREVLEAGVLNPRWERRSQQSPVSEKQILASRPLPSSHPSLSVPEGCPAWYTWLGSGGPSVFLM